MPQLQKSHNHILRDLATRGFLPEANAIWGFLAWQRLGSPAPSHSGQKHLTLKAALTCYFDSCFSSLRVLEPEPPRQTLLHQHPEAAAGHRAVGHVSDASGVLPLLTRRLEAGDPADVWRAQGQREGEKFESRHGVRQSLDLYYDIQNSCFSKMKELFATYCDFMDVQVWNLSSKG